MGSENCKKLQMLNKKSILALFFFVFVFGVFFGVCVCFLSPRPKMGAKISHLQLAGAYCKSVWANITKVSEPRISLAV